MTDKQPPFVIHVSEMADFPDAVYIGRENGRMRLKRSKWANLFKIDKKRDGRYARTNAINFFNGMVAINYNNMRDDIAELTGKPLACWCRRSDEPRTDDNMCHGDVLVELWKGQNKTPAEAVAKALEETFDPCGSGWIEEATASIAAHTAYLWKRAMQPDVLEAAAKDMWDETRHLTGNWIDWKQASDLDRESFREKAERTLVTSLTLLLGPQPEEAQDEVSH